jgi:Ca2+-binding RTX toxin-like protein
MRRNRFKPLRRFEKLEDRRMMAADIDLDNGILTIEGTDNRDLIYVQYDPNDADEIRVRIFDGQTYEMLEEENYDREDVQQVVAYAFNGDDFLKNYSDIAATFYGGGDDDILHGGSANDWLDGGEGNDILFGHQGNDDLLGGVGDDNYQFSGTTLGSDVVHEDASQDRDLLDLGGLAGPANIDLSITTAQTVNPTHLTLRLTSATGIEDVIGTDFDDTIFGNSRNNYLSASNGSDTIYGRGGDDELRGGWGTDYLYGDAGFDKLYGGSDLSSDYLYGGTENDYLYGGHGDDWLYGGAGHDTLLGEFGHDHLYGEAGLDLLWGGEQDDWLYGGGDDDELYGEAGDDHLDGGLGRDTLDGGSDDDYLDGGYDNYEDLLWGGLGRDTFVRHQRRSGRHPLADRRMDFNSAEDLIETILH